MNIIFMTIDNKFEDYARACLNSMETNYPNHPLILLFVKNVSEAFKEWCRSYVKNVEIRENIFSHNHSNLGVVNSNRVYDRLEIWSREFDEYNTILHLDADILVLKPLDELFENELLIIENGEPHPSVRAFCNVDDELKKLLKEDGIDYDADNQPPMSNSGVFTVGKKYRLEKTYKEIQYLARRYSKWLQFADQSILTLYYYKNKYEITNKVEYNYQTSLNTVERLVKPLKDVYILHYSTRKPNEISFVLWTQLGGKNRELKSLYDMYLFR